MLQKTVAPLASIITLERERLTSLINSMADGVIATDENANVVVYNGAALDIIDINTSMTGKSISEILKLVDPEYRPVDARKLIVETTTPHTSRNYRLPYPDGSLINLYLSIAPVRLGFGQIGARGYVLLLRDITREKSLEEERDEFISVVSHELRTPIAIAEGNISNARFIVEKNGDLRQVKDALRQAEAQINFLGGMINDLATLSRAERGTLNIEVEDINTHDLAEELAESYRPEANGKGLTINTAIDPTVELLKSSKLYVREILQNFMTNAIKYTEKGGITLTVRPSHDAVIFEVSDTGIGITKSDQAKVFDKFFRSEDYRTRESSGTGLGLYVTTKLAHIIHAEISLKSELDQGSTFTILIPNFVQQ